MTNKEIFILACMQYLTLPYKWGGDDPIKGFDCSGLIQELYSMVNLDPSGDQTAQGLHDWFKLKDMGGRKLGTLCFYGKHIGSITHVGMLLDDFLMIEAGGGGSKTNTPDDAASQNAYVRIRPYNRRADLVAVVTPRGLPW